MNDNLFPAIKALLHPGTDGGSEGNPDGNGPGGNYGPGGDYPSGGSFPGGGTGAGGSSGGTGGGSYYPGGGTNNPNDTANTDPPIHGGGTHIPFPGGTQINPVPTPFPVFEQPDSNGFYPSRIAAADVYFQDHPNGAIDCSDLVGFFGDMWQRWQNVANYQVPATVEQRISDIINQYFFTYDEDNFKIEKIEDAKGPTINCDFFALHINTLPQNTLGMVMTPEELLDYLRENLNDFDNLGNNTPGFYGIYNDAPNDGLNDADKFYAGYGASLGGLAHFNNNVPYTLGTVYNDGTVIESGYNQDPSDLYWIYTTMKSPLDGQHPVSGNRKFGIFPDAANGGYELYIMGVDRTTDNFTTFMNNYFKVVFSNADAWWISIITGAKNYINSHDGNAEFYTDPNGGFINRRVLWDGPMGQFLRKEITLQQLMNLYNCP